MAQDNIQVVRSTQHHTIIGTKITEQYRVSGTDLFIMYCEGLLIAPFHYAVSSAYAVTRGLLFQNDDFTDCTLRCGEETFTAHRTILSACSPYFYELLKHNNINRPVLHLIGIDPVQFGRIVSFMYSGVCEVPELEMDSFLDTAAFLKIVSLDDGRAGDKVAQITVEGGINKYAETEHLTQSNLPESFLVGTSRSTGSIV